MNLYHLKIIHLYIWLSVTFLLFHFTYSILLNNVIFPNSFFFFLTSKWRKMYVLLNPMHFPSYMNHKKMTFFLRFVNLISNTRKNKKYLKDDLLSVFIFFLLKNKPRKKIIVYLHCLGLWNYIVRTKFTLSGNALPSPRRLMLALIRNSLSHIIPLFSFLRMIKFQLKL